MSFPTSSPRRVLTRGLAVVTAAALALGASACSATKAGTQSSASGTTGAGTVKIGLVTKTDTNPYFVKLRDSAKEQAGSKNRNSLNSITWIMRTANEIFDIFRLFPARLIYS